MAYTEHIQNLITAAESMPRSLWKNRGISHLRDALACFNMLDDKTPVSNVTTPENGPEKATAASYEVAGCTCRPGMIDSKCPIHGGSTAAA